MKMKTYKNITISIFLIALISSAFNFSFKQEENTIIEVNVGDQFSIDVKINSCCRLIPPVYDKFKLIEFLKVRHEHVSTTLSDTLCFGCSIVDTYIYRAVSPGTEHIVFNNVIGTDSINSPNTEHLKYTIFIK